MKEILSPESGVHIRETLVLLNDFLSSHDINYEVTGTTALYLLGAYIGKNEMPHDIDLRVTRILTDEQKKAIEQQQALSGRKLKNYGDQVCYTFECNSILVNVFVVDVAPVSFDSVKVEIMDFVNMKRALVNVQDVYNSLREKMKLGRPKDKDFMLGLIASLSNL